jgi:phosphomannomutase/phosphoglucomutase
VLKPTIFREYDIRGVGDEELLSPDMAGEMNGHMFFADRYYGFDDATYAACRLMEIVANSGQPLSAQLAGMPKIVTTPEIRFDCPDELKFAVVHRATEELRASHKILDVDGVRVLFPQGWGLVRASNTQPVLVMRFEAETEELLREYRREVEDVVTRAVAAERGKGLSSAL